MKCIFQTTFSDIFVSSNKQYYSSKPILTEMKTIQSLVQLLVAKQKISPVVLEAVKGGHKYDDKRRVRSKGAKGG